MTVLDLLEEIGVAALPGLSYLLLGVMFLG
jgi:hypothetical protein